jgi:hypothetical protein
MEEGREGKHDGGEPMIAGQMFTKALIVASEPAKSAHPSKASLDEPPAGQENKALSGFGQLHYGQLDSVLGRVLENIGCKYILQNYSREKFITGSTSGH